MPCVAALELQSICKGLFVRSHEASKVLWFLC